MLINKNTQIVSHTILSEIIYWCTKQVILYQKKKTVNNIVIRYSDGLCSIYCEKKNNIIRL